MNICLTRRRRILLRAKLHSFHLTRIKNASGKVDQSTRYMFFLTDILGGDCLHVYWVSLKQFLLWPCLMHGGQKSSFIKVRHFECLSVPWSLSFAEILIARWQMKSSYFKEIEPTWCPSIVVGVAVLHVLLQFNFPNTPKLVCCLYLGQ